MYARTDGKQTLTFQVSGMLWHRSLVMQDRETKSLWSHLLGECMRGELKGTRLEAIPSAMTDWKTWRTKHPQTTVAMLSRTSNNYRREFYRDPSKFLIGIAEGSSARAWPFDRLKVQPVVNDTFGKRPLLIVFAKESATAFIYDRRLGEQELKFALKDDRLVDAKTGSTWDWATGRATGGPLAGKQLKPLAGVVSYRRPWDVFHPKTVYWEAR